MSKNGNGISPDQASSHFSAKAKRLNFLQRCYEWIHAPRVKMDEELSFSNAAEFIAKDLDDSFYFNKKIVWIGCISMGIWFLLMIRYAFVEGWTVFLDKDVYPALIFGLVTVAFSEMEIDNKKREFCQHLIKYLDKPVDGRVGNIDNDKVKDTWWDEFKNRFQ